MDDKEAARFRGYDVSKKMTDTHQVIRKPIVIRDCDTGDIVLAYAPKYFNPDIIEKSAEKLLKYAPLTGFRGEAAGKADPENIRANISGKGKIIITASKETSWADIKRYTGSKINLSNFVMSGNLGYYSRKRLNTIREAIGDSEEATNLISESVRFLQEYTPEIYKTMHSAINDDYRFGGKESPFTTITVNKDFQTAMHRDKGNLNGYAVLTATHMGQPFKGGNLHFPQYGIAVPLRKGDALVANVKLLHGNEGITHLDKDSSRVSFVLYAREEFKR